MNVSPILLDLPFKHKGIMCAPLLSEIHIEQYLSDKIEQIIVGGENYSGSRPCHYEWVKSLYHQAPNTILHLHLLKQEHAL